jgi:hypothetical protein
MIRIISISLIVSLGTLAYGQVVKGTIYDSDTKMTIPYAAVYFTGSLAGTASDQDGRFELDISKFATKPITIRAIGYETYILNDATTDTEYEIFLKPSSFDLEEAVISTKSLARKRKAYLKLFRNEFLGTTGNQRQCTILNESDIKFDYAHDKDTIRAYTVKPLVVNNNSLGYVITYYLDAFEYDKRTNIVNFIGDIVFTEDLAIRDSVNRASYFKKRKEAYIGSCMNFFRALWANTLEANGFSFSKVSKDLSKTSVIHTLATNKWIGYNDVVFEDSRHQKFFKSTDDLNIEYNGQTTRVIFLKPLVRFEQNGFFDPTGLEWHGPMADQRIADILPYEYYTSEIY